MSKTSHYKAPTKRGFEAGELAGLLASHSPNADYKVVISLRGKVRELIVTEDGSGREAVAGALAGEEVDAGACLPPVDDQAHGGKFEAAFHDPRLGPRTWGAGS